MEHVPAEKSEIDLKLPLILERLNSRFSNVRAEGERELRQLGPDCVQPLLTLLAEERSKRKRNRRMLPVTIAWCIFVPVVLSALTHYRMVIQPVYFIIAAIIAAFTPSRTQRSIAKALARHADLRTVGALAEALEYRDKVAAKAAAAALVRLLPTMKASDAGLLDAEQRRCLCHALNGNNAVLKVAILKAFEQVGDEQALPMVEFLADGKGAAANNSFIRAAAQECLPALRQRTAQKQFRQTLLRAANSTDAQSINAHNLLRPAMDAGTSNPDQLLRAALDDYRLVNSPPELIAVESHTRISIQSSPTEEEVITLRH